MKYGVSRETTRSSGRVELNRRDSSLAPETRTRLERFVGLLNRWRGVTDLISEKGFHEVWSRHVLDCLQLFELSERKLRWIDIGTGAGFPGIILAIQAADASEARIHCVEKDGRKCVFLRQVARELCLPVTVHNCRVETLDPEALGEIDVVTARAFASLSQIVRLARPYLNQGAMALLLRGETVDRELADPALLDFTIERLPNRVYSEGSVLRLRVRA